jgi:hypothetical protein
VPQLLRQIEFVHDQQPMQFEKLRRRANARDAYVASVAVRLMGTARSALLIGHDASACFA